MMGEIEPSIRRYMAMLPLFELSSSASIKISYLQQAKPPEMPNDM